jgi:hypothetical protein
MYSDMYKLFARNINNVFQDKNNNYKVSFSPFHAEGKGTYTESYNEKDSLPGEYEFDDRNDGLYIIKAAVAEYRIEKVEQSHGKLLSFSMVDTFSGAGFNLTADNQNKE